MKKYFGRGEIIFSMTLSYFFTWTSALYLQSWGWREARDLIGIAFIYFLLISVLLWIATRLTKHHIFGRKKAYYFPYKSMALVSIICSAIYGLINYIQDKLPMTTLHLSIYIIGFILGIGVQMLCFYFLTKKEN